VSERTIQRAGYKVVFRGEPCIGAFKDVRCEACGCERQTLVESVTWSSGELACPGCGAVTAHVALATGGLRSRYRYHDWGGGAAEGHVRYEGMLPAQIEKLDANGDGTGEWVDYDDPDAAAKRASGKYSVEAREERRKQIKADMRRERGSAPLIFDAAKP
jgi:ribosomal protein S27E